MLSQHLVNLLHASLRVFFASLGTTVLGFVAMLLDSLASIGISLWRILRTGGIDAMRQHWTGTAKIALQTTFLVTLGIYGPIFLYSVARAIYNDHEWQVARRLELEKKLPAQAQEIQELKDKLNATCYLPDRRLTQEEHDVLYSHLKAVAKKHHSPKISVGLFVGDSESNRYLASLVDILSNAGFRLNSVVERPRRIQSTDPPDLGLAEGLSVSLETRKDSEEQRENTQLGEDIMQAFAYARVQIAPYPIGPSWPLKESKLVTIWVGYKKTQ